MYRSFVSLGRYTPKYFILFVAMVNGIVSLISLSVFSLLVYRNARNFCVLILYPATDYIILYSDNDIFFLFLMFLSTLVVFCSVQSLSCVRLFSVPWTTAHQASLSITNSWSLLRFISIELVKPPNHLILCCPLLLLPSVFPSIRVFSNESALCIRWPKYWNFSFNISPSNEYSGLIPFRMDWLDILAVQGTLKSLLQYHN